MYSGEYDACDVTLSTYPHRASLKNMPVHGGNQTRGQAYFSSLPGVDIHSVTSQASYSPQGSVHIYIKTENIMITRLRWYRRN